MALPELIEIVPLDKPVRAEITVPGSKSITNRALILAALADGEVTLTGALWSEDTQIMVECLQKSGFEIRVENDPAEFCNRTITVKGLGGKIPNAGTADQPLELFVGNAGTAARFLSAFVCLGNGVYRLSGVARMHERPQAALFSALRELGYRVESENGNDKLPVEIFAERGCVTDQPQQFGRAAADASRTAALRSCKVSIEESSQFASALLLCAKVGNWKVEVVGENAEESPYVAMTLKLMEAFPKNGGTFQIEPDASSGSYFWAADMVAPNSIFLGGMTRELQFSSLDFMSSLGKISKSLPIGIAHSDWCQIIREEFIKTNQPKSVFQGLEWYENSSSISVAGVPGIFSQEPKSGLQIDAKFPGVWPGSVELSRLYDLGDSIMTAIVLAPFTHKGIKFTDLGRLRVQETERVVALRTELTKCGAKVVEEGDTLTVWPSPLHGAEIETYNDHRMAMCFAILGLKVPGIKIKNPACVKKTFPNFFQKLAAVPPHGLGAEIWEIKNGLRIRKLSGEDLFAD
jgi:3-phosphoshikimate 1-carboxyvinyltransferase